MIVKGLFKKRSNLKPISLRIIKIRVKARIIFKMAIIKSNNVSERSNMMITPIQKSLITSFRNSAMPVMEWLFETLLKVIEVDVKASEKNMPTQ